MTDVEIGQRYRDTAHGDRWTVTEAGRHVVSLESDDGDEWHVDCEMIDRMRRYNELVPVE
jgi:hypothetical protein